jgi:dihydroorotase
VEGFVSTFGREFYGVREEEGKSVMLRKGGGKKVDESWVSGGESVIPFWAGKELRWEIVED